VTFRARVIVAAAAAVAVAVALAAAAAYLAARSSLRSEVDAALRARADVFKNVAIPLSCLRLGETPLVRLPNPRLGGAPGYVQVICLGAAPVRPPGENVVLPIDERARATARGEKPAFFEDARVANTHVRVLTLPVDDGVALQVARPLEEVDRVLQRLRLIMVTIAVGGVGLAAGLGLVVGGAALRPVRRLTEAAEEVARTRDLSLRVEGDGEDELARLSATFNAMLAALQESVGAQRRLVVDASHELRTPLTSLRTNVEVLARADELAPDERERLRQDVLGQVDELTVLVRDVVDLAHGDEPVAQPEELRLDELVDDAVERARRNAPQVRFQTWLEPVRVRGVPLRLERAVANLLDNAAKWSPDGSEVLVTVRDGAVTVEDHGPGFEPEDLPYVFDRFYRARGARGKPGSGLGLAIVRQVAEEHGGRVEAANANGGGAVVTLRVPA